PVTHVSRSAPARVSAARVRTSLTTTLPVRSPVSPTFSSASSPLIEMGSSRASPSSAGMTGIGPSSTSPSAWPSASSSSGTCPANSSAAASCSGDSSPPPDAVATSSAGRGWSPANSSASSSARVDSALEGRNAAWSLVCTSDSDPCAMPPSPPTASQARRTRTVRSARTTAPRRPSDLRWLGPDWPPLTLSTLSNMIESPEARNRKDIVTDRELDRSPAAGAARTATDGVAFPPPETWPTGRLLSAAARRVERAWDTYLAQWGLTHASVPVLVVLARGSLSQREIAAHMHVTEQTIGRVLRGLQASGHISRAPHAEDRRRHVVSLTED